MARREKAVTLEIDDASRRGRVTVENYPADRVPAVGQQLGIVREDGGVHVWFALHDEGLNPDVYSDAFFGGGLVVTKVTRMPADSSTVLLTVERLRHA